MIANSPLLKSRKRGSPPPPTQVVEEDQQESTLSLGIPMISQQQQQEQLMVNPQYFLEHCRKIHYELGDIYSQQVGLKYIANEAIFAKMVSSSCGASKLAK